MNKFTIDYHGPHGGNGKKVVMISSVYVTATNEEATAAANDPEIWKASGRLNDLVEVDQVDGQRKYILESQWKMAEHWTIDTPLTGEVEFDNPHIDGRGRVVWLMESK